MNLREELKSAGVYPTGPVSAWPVERKNKMLADATARMPSAESLAREARKKKMPGLGKLASGLTKTAAQAVMNGRVSKEIREERYETCKACPLFDSNTKRCTDCGCFMEAKTWVGGNPDTLCPKQKWSR